MSKETTTTRVGTSTVLEKNGATYYVHSQEVWSKAKCAKVAKCMDRDSLGTAGLHSGCVSPSGASYPTYGQEQLYNGGCVRDGEWYNGEIIPLPKIPASYEFYTISSWGTYIRKKMKKKAKQ